MTKENITSKSDHDLLIELKTEFSIFTKQYGVDMKDLKENFTFRVVDVESRVKKIEDNVYSQSGSNSSLKQDLEALKGSPERIDRIENILKWIGFLVTPAYLGFVGFLVGKFFGLFK